MSDEAMAGIVAVLLLAFGFVIGFGVGDGASEKACQQAAIEAGAARWAIDPTTGERRFEYLRATKEAAK